MLKNSVYSQSKITGFKKPPLTYIEKVSVVIVTRNRAKALSDCLNSLEQQTLQPAEYVIIDNDSTDQTAQVVTKFGQKLNTKFGHKTKVRRVLEKRLGYPMVYNRGLKEAAWPWVIFIDDDCVADQNWLMAYAKNIKAAAKTVVALVGQSQTKLPATVWALAVLAADQFWKFSVISPDNQVLDLETLDNKNVAYFRPFLLQHGIAFNELAVSEPGAGAAEDADLGMQLMQAGAQANYVAEALIWHQDPNQMSWYLHRLKSGALANFYYQHRWSKVRKNLGCLKLRQGIRFRDFWPKFCQTQNLTGFRALKVLVIIRLSFWLIQNWQKTWSKSLVPSK